MKNLHVGIRFKNILYPLFALAIVFSAFSCTDDDTYTLGVWKSHTDFNGVARSFAVSFTVDSDSAYICGGYKGRTNDRLKDLWRFSMSRGSYTQRASMPDEAKGRSHAVGFAINGKGYVATGKTTETEYLDDVWEYDPKQNSWSQKDNYPYGPVIEALAFSIGNYGYVGTGYDKDEDGINKEFYKFDPSAASGSQWTYQEDFMPDKRRGGLAFVIDDKAYIGLGINNNTNNYDFWRFDPSSSNPWTKLYDLYDYDDDEDFDDDYAAIQRAYAVALVIDGKAYITTGESLSSYRSDYWIYDPEIDLWYNYDPNDDKIDLTNYKSGKISFSARRGAVAFGNGKRGFFATGEAGSTTQLDDTWELLPYEYEED